MRAGSSFARYQILRCVGTGGMGAVYEAVHVLLRKRVALKVMHAPYGLSGDALVRFVREAETTARIRHANVVDIADVGVEQGIPFLVMELLEGEDLSRLLKREGRLSFERAVDLILPVVAGLAAVHRLGIVHRDVKPENVFLSLDTRGETVPKIVDFGVSKDVTAALQQGAQLHHTVAGTPCYMAPEQVRGSSQLDGRTDQYAVGVLLYQCLTGARPFEAPSLLGLMQAIDSGEYQPLDVRCPDLPDALQAIVQRAMSRCIEDRFASMEAFGQALSNFASEPTRRAYAGDFEPPRRPSVPPERWTEEALAEYCASVLSECNSSLNSSSPAPGLDSRANEQPAGCDALTAAPRSRRQGAPRDSRPGWLCWIYLARSELSREARRILDSMTRRHALLRQAQPLHAFVLLSLWVLGCDPLHTDLTDSKPVYRHARAHPTNAPAAMGTLRIMNWNIKFGGARIDFFFDCFGDRVLMTHHEVVENLDQLAAAIRHFSPDVLLLQEVDINSKRSDYIDQLQYLLDHTQLNHGVYASQWRADFIPSDGLGAMDNGNAILSRWPIRNARRIPLSLRTDQGTAERYFYLQRNILTAVTDIPGADPLVVINTHADAYGKDGTKLEHIARFEQELERFDAAGMRFVAGGDLNTLPPGTTKLSGFPDTVCKDESYVADDYTGETGALLGLYATYEPYVTTDTYASDQERYFTHTVQGPASGGFWNRTLDYLFTNGDFVDLTGTVHQDEASGGIDTMLLSDHAPVEVELVWP